MITKTATIPAGYKQTEIGVIPADWTVKPLKGLCVDKGLVRGPFGGALKKAYFVDKGIKVYEQQNAIYRDFELGDYFIDHNRYIGLKRFEVRPNDFIVSCSGTIGKIYLIPRNAPKGIINQALLKITTDEAVVSKDYFLHYFDWDHFQERIIDSTQGGAMKNLVGMSIFRETLIPVPTSKVEQTAIATALSETDDLIARLKKLIEKKKNINRGVMQELLTGKRRLPGFIGEWEMKPLGDLFDFSGGFSASRDQLTTEGHCYLHYGDIHLSSKTFIDVQSESSNIPKLDIPLKEVARDSLLGDGDVVFVDASEDDEGTSKHVVIRNKDNIPFISGLHTIVAKSKTSELDHEYRRFCFQTTDIKRQFYFFAVGTKVSGISKTNIAKVALPVPKRPEQSAIAAILSDMDAEIEKLESQLTKYRDIKQGMMQSLLTGKIRLI